MKGFLKNLGLIMIIIGALFLIIIAVSGSSAVNSNGALSAGILLIILGILAYIILNKRITD